MSLRLLMAQRRAKIEEWRALGCEPYAYRFDATHDAAALLVQADKDAPEECPACAHPQAHFELLGENW